MTTQAPTQQKYKAGDAVTITTEDGKIINTCVIDFLFDVKGQNFYRLDNDHGKAIAESDISPRTVDNLAIALALAGRGWAVFPCHEKEWTDHKKQPRKEKEPYWHKDIPNGKDNASIDPEQIKIWWKRWPGALIGVYCEKSGIFAVDIDTKNGINGLASWADLVETKGGGQHLIFKLPKDVKIPNNAGKLGPGLDLRSNGYICTGSLANGKSYIWLPDHGPESILTEAPGWLLDHIRIMGSKAGTPKTPDTTPSQSRPAGQSPTETGEYWLEKYVKMAYVGNRGYTAFEMGCQLRDSGLSIGDAEKYARLFAQQVAQGGEFNENEALTSVQSAYKREARTPAKRQGGPAFSGNGHHPQPATPTAQPPENFTGDDPSDYFTADLDPNPAQAPAVSGVSDTQTEKPDPWEAFTLADAYKVRPPLEYIAGRMFELPSLNIVYGAPGSLKSFILADLAVSVAAGQPWLTPAPWIKSSDLGIQTNKKPIMWLDFDNGRRRTHERFSALARVRGLGIDAPIVYYSMPRPWLESTKIADMGNLTLRIKRQGARLVVVDNLGLVSGDADENSSEMAAVMSQWRQLAEDSGAAVILIHHQRKSNGMSGRAGENLRGHSSIEAALDLALLVEREEASEQIKIKATKARGEEVLPFSAAFTFENNLDTGELQHARFYGIATEDNQSGRAIEAAIMTALLGTSMNKTELKKAAQSLLKTDDGKAPGINRISDYIARLVADGQLVEKPGANNTERFYTRK